VSTGDIVVAVVLGLGVFTVLYAFVRVPWRLWHGDIEAAGSDGRTFKRDRPGRIRHFIKRLVKPS
jgi:hypothetical protein